MGMDELSKKLGEILNSPDSMEKIQSAMAALGIGDQEPEEEEETDGGDGLSGLLAALGSSGEKKKKAALPPSGGGDGMPDLAMLAKIAPVMSSMRGDDQNTVLLKALRPYLHGDREKRLDDAIKILRFIKVMPLLRDKGLF